MYLKSALYTVLRHVLPFFLNDGISSYSGCSSKSYLVSQFDTVIHNLNAQIKHLEIILEEIVELAKALPNYDSIRSIPGIGNNLAARILAEIGDVNRFNCASQLVAYVGIDPQIYQSGQISGLHLKISKKGNKKLRCLLYLAVTCMIKTSRNTVIVDFYKKKKADGLASKSALVASMNKLVRLIYSLCKNGCLFK